MPKPATDESLFRAVGSFLADAHGKTPTKYATHPQEVPILHRASTTFGLPIGSLPDPTDPTNPMKEIELHVLDYRDIQTWIGLCSDPTIVEAPGQAWQAYTDVITYLATARDMAETSKVWTAKARKMVIGDPALLFEAMADKLDAAQCRNATELIQLANDVDELSDPRFGDQLSQLPDFQRKVEYLARLAASVPSMVDPAIPCDVPGFVERVQLLRLDGQNGESRVRAVLDNAADNPGDRLDALEQEAEQGHVRGPLDEDDVNDQEDEDAAPGEHPH